MNYLDSIKRAGRSLKNAKARTLLTSLAIAVGAFTLTAALAAGTGARQYVNTLIESNIDPNSVFVAKDDSLFGPQGPPGAAGLQEYSEDRAEFGDRSFEALTQDDVENLEALETVSSVTPTYLVNAQYVTFEGIDQRYTSQITAYDDTVLATAVSGDLPPLNTQIKDDEIVIPESYAKTLDKPVDGLIGSEVTLRVAKLSAAPSQDDIQDAFIGGGPDEVEKLFDVESKDVTFTVRAVSAESATSFSASSALFISSSAARDLSEYITEGTDQFQKYLAATVRTAEGSTPEQVKSDVEGLELAARTPQDLNDLLFSIVNIIQSIVIVFGVLALLASIFGIVNTQYIAVLERTREIGLMKALGMRGRHVSRLFQLEAAWIGFIGGALGAGIAIAVGVAINPWLTDLIGIEQAILVFEPLPILGLIIGLMLIAMLAGYFPARKAAKLNPIDALRSE